MADFEERFVGDRRGRMLLSLARALGYAAERDGTLHLTRRGAFCVHLAQNLFSLSYINRIWSQARREAWPEVVPF